MAAAAGTGAPPPPPPPLPPSPPSSPPLPSDNIFDHIPAELLLIICRFAGLGDLMNLALAIYPTLRCHNLVPDLSIFTLTRIISEWRGRSILSANTSAASRMPVELWLQTADHLELADTTRLVLALGNRFYNFRGRPTRETEDRLRIWSRRARRK
ncbi:hypothetical protein EJ02DRAFT_143145 [Clathrospora elynae]|uniref:F-box domain-containing protein n=1 Tax=Clathrospora elynae TaxID=706981 RepID=A0A6A5SVP6_9PLEO|nr:hypothetical protein EJ02DRAFT_143145 [Clathrospora elynae]